MTNKEAMSILASMMPKDYSDAIRGSATVQDVNDKCDALFMAIKALEAQQWIPCSERLPEDEGYYLVTLGDDGFPDRDVEIVAMQDGDWDWNPIEQVMAWMPLPEPYEEKDV